VHHLFDPADPIEGDHAMVFRRECPDILLGSLTNDLGGGRRTLGIEHLE
jgi:hypothetical protein